MREWRKTHPPSNEQLRRIRARAYARTYLRRGLLQREPCQVCGRSAQMHHDDYTKPLQVRWFCYDHHIELHRHIDRIASASS
jgi:hypothetical protein